VYGQTKAGQAPAGQAPSGPALSAATAGKSFSPDKVVLKVGDVSMTQKEIDTIIAGLTPQAQSNLAHQGRRPLGDDFVKMLVLSQDALSQHLDSTPAYKEMLALHRREVLAQLAYQKILQQSTVTPEEISSYYAGHQSEFEEAELYQVMVREKPAGAKDGTPGLTAEEAQARAEEIRKAMISGDDPKKVAEKYQLANLVRVDSYPEIVHHGEMQHDMEKAAFELKDGQVSEVFNLGYALAFIKVGSRKVLELKAVSPKIESTLQQGKINSALDALKKKANVWMDDAYFAPPAGARPQKPPPPPAVYHVPITPTPQ
jgi:parvulin-like peptidyl-prolyl isomerase